MLLFPHIAKRIKLPLTKMVALAASVNKPQDQEIKSGVETEYTESIVKDHVIPISTVVSALK